MSNRVRLLLYISIFDTFFVAVYAIAVVFVRELGGDEPLFLQSTQLAHLITRRMHSLYGEIDILQKILRQYRFLKEIMNTRRVLELILLVLFYLTQIVVYFLDNIKYLKTFF